MQLIPGSMWLRPYLLAVSGTHGLDPISWPCLVHVLETLSPDHVWYTWSRPYLLAVSSAQITRVCMLALGEPGKLSASCVSLSFLSFLSKISFHIAAWLQIFPSGDFFLVFGGARGWISEPHCFDRQTEMQAQFCSVFCPLPKFFQHAAWASLSPPTAKLSQPTPGVHSLISAAAFLVPHSPGTIKSLWGLMCHGFFPP